MAVWPGNEDGGGRLAALLFAIGLVLATVAVNAAEAPLPAGWERPAGGPLLLGDFNGDGSVDEFRLLHRPAGDELALFFSLAVPAGWRHHIALVLPRGSDPAQLRLDYQRPAGNGGGTRREAASVRAALPDGRVALLAWQTGDVVVRYEP